MAPDALPPPTRTSARRRWRILARGAVQGVGFRPFVHQRATALGLAGWVRNSADGLAVEVEGEAGRINALIRAIREAPPVNASVAAIDVQEVAPCGETTFRIRASEAASAPTAQILPDLATCADCLAELLDPANRRHLYPFINCTQCGPRYSIVEAIPYDRARTSMRHFAMCPDCRHEYEDPADRRFHAEPNACPVCGPRLALWDEAGAVLARDHPALLAAAEAVRQGRIVAVKGIGGFHLLTDARNEAAIRRLRARKRRAEKPFAVMFPSLAAILESCRVAPAEATLLAAPARPIVLLPRTGGPVAAAVAPGHPWLGALLPYAPIHHLLLRELGFPVVATSGNISEEPIVADEHEALDRLAGFAEAFLVHDRPIVRALDDSVARIVCGRELLLRRARGYAPAPIAAATVQPGILALGGHLKTTIALTAPSGVILSQHIGDLDAVAGRAAHGRVIADMARLHAIRPRLVVRDLHPDYASSRSAAELRRPIVAIPHHLAHVAACMAEHGLAPPALGVAWDGSGYGPDGTIWGGEFLLVGEAGWRRAAHLRSFSLPGGEAAAREPRRAALGLLFEAFGEEAFAMTDLAPVAAFTAAERTVLLAMLTRRVNAPHTTSAGRLFDGFAALCGLRQRASYEGQAAAEFEGAAGRRTDAGRYEFPVRETATNPSLVVDWQPALQRACADLRSGRRPGAVSAAVHDGLAAAIAEVAVRIGERRVLLTGGCFQNARLTAAAVAALRSAGCVPEWHRRVPPNDGGLALGQAAWAAWNEKRGATPCA